MDDGAVHDRADISSGDSLLSILLPSNLPALILRTPVHHRLNGSVAQPGNGFSESL